MKKKINKKIKKYHWLIVLILTTTVAMWIYGMVYTYFPDPWYIGFGQYLDVGVGIVIFTLLISGFIIGTIFKKTKKKK